MAGRIPKPTELKLIEGNRGKRAINKQEPDPEYLEADNLTPPAWLPDAAKAVWNEVVPDLQKARLVAKIDVELLAHGCAAAARCRRATIEAEANPVLVGAKGKGGSINLWLIVQSMSFKQMDKVLGVFGVGPAARTRIALQPQMDLFGADAPSGQGEKPSKYFAAS
jgi:P27 family predicted phage terminase small subunit